VITLAECTGKTVDKHLSFQKGELILVREQKDATWYSGQLRGKVKILKSYLLNQEKRIFLFRLDGFQEIMLDQRVKWKYKIKKIRRSK
jgi:hypothetical protein